MSETLSRFDRLRAAAIRLAFHDVAADERARQPHCAELQWLIEELGGKPSEYGKWTEMFTQDDP